MGKRLVESPVWVMWSKKIYRETTAKTAMINQLSTTKFDVNSRHISFHPYPCP